MQVNPRPPRSKAETDEVSSSWEGPVRRPLIGNLDKQVCFERIAAEVEIHSRAQQKKQPFRTSFLFPAYPSQADTQNCHLRTEETNTSQLHAGVSGSMQEPHCLAPLPAVRPKFSTDLDSST